jgi:hypothetical protein
MNYKSQALTFLDDQLDKIENQVKDHALFIAHCRKETLVTPEIMAEAFESVIKRFVA